MARKLRWKTTQEMWQFWRQKGSSVGPKMAARVSSQTLFPSQFDAPPLRSILAGIWKVVVALKSATSTLFPTPPKVMITLQRYSPFHRFETMKTILRGNDFARFSNVACSGYFHVGNIPLPGVIENKNASKRNENISPKITRSKCKRKLARGS